ncbi:hypothetical protein AGMMS49521_3910 [Campylobacterota bacterium]|nr:hypothetical protein AGMMS49521_3910 [Campylobacterota bacterium]GHV04172.1 hypothetical protein AGMMS50229_04950 [Campylobacterota bacterium]
MRLILACMLLSASAFAVELGKTYRFTSGEEAYEKVCAYCHTINIGVKTIYMKMDDAAGVKARSEGIFQTVRNGQNAMPSFRQSEISDDVLMDLATKLANGTITYKQ